MSFFQNPFDQEFQGYLPVIDKRAALSFKVPANLNKSDAQLAWNIGPYDFSSDDELTINYAHDSAPKNWATLTINVAGATASATTAQEVVTILNDNATFADMFLAEVKNYSSGQTVYIRPSPTRKVKVKLYFSNTGAEKHLRFNKRAGVAELPIYFDRHTIENRFNFEDSVGLLIALDEADALVDIPIIEDAGFDPLAMKADWELLEGRSTALFTFKKQAVTVNNQITEIIEYGAGAKVGDMAIKTIMTYTGTQTAPDTICKIPYVLTSGDLITP